MILGLAAFSSEDVVVGLLVVCDGGVVDVGGVDDVGADNGSAGVDEVEFVTSSVAVDFDVCSVFIVGVVDGDNGAVVAVGVDVGIDVEDVAVVCVVVVDVLAESSGTGTTPGSCLIFKSDRRAIGETTELFSSETTIGFPTVPSRLLEPSGLLF